MYFIKHGKGKLISGDSEKKLEAVVAALNNSWSPETSSWGDELPKDNSARGQCMASSLVVQDYLGGDLVRVKVEGDGIDEKHYFNILDDGTIIDTTGKQYEGLEVSLSPAPVDLGGKYDSIRLKLLADKDVSKWYGLLAGKVKSMISKKERENA